MLKITKIGKYYGAKLGGKSRFFYKDHNCTALFHLLEKMPQFSLDWFKGPVLIFEPHGRGPDPLSQFFSHIWGSEPPQSIFSKSAINYFFSSISRYFQMYSNFLFFQYCGVWSWIFLFFRGKMGYFREFRNQEIV